MRDVSQAPGSGPAGRHDVGSGDWVVVIEATTDGGPDGFDFDKVQDLLGRLREWRSSGLYNPRRYAIQLRITAEAPHEALRRAVAYHDLAARAVGLSNVSVTRAEVLTVAEFELGGPLAPAPAAPPSGGGQAPRTRNPLISDDLYGATRALLRATSVAQITEVLVRFVTAVGGSVNLGECRSVAGMIAVDISVEEGQLLSAVAESMSVAGMILEQTLPSLVADARLAVLRLTESDS